MLNLLLFIRLTICLLFSYDDTEIDKRCLDKDFVYEKLATIRQFNKRTGEVELNDFPKRAKALKAKNKSEAIYVIDENSIFRLMPYEQELGENP